MSLMLLDADSVSAVNRFDCTQEFMSLLHLDADSVQ